MTRANSLLLFRLEMPSIILFENGLSLKLYSFKMCCNASLPSSTMERWLSEKWDVKCHMTALPRGGRSGEVGLRRQTIRVIGAFPSSSKSPASFPNERRAGRSRLVQVVRTVSVPVSGCVGRFERLINVRNMFVPGSLGRFDARRLLN